MADPKKHGFFATLKTELIRGFSPARTRPCETPSRHVSSFSLFRKKTHPQGESLVPRSGSLRPVIEGPDTDDGLDNKPKRTASNLRDWVMNQSTHKRSDLRLLLGVMAAPLAPVSLPVIHPPRVSLKNTPIESSSAQYILQQYTAACGGAKLLSKVRNSYAMGKVKMLANEFESATKLVKSRANPKVADSGGFVLWQMSSGLWYVELAVSGTKVYAGCNGRVVWRHTPWLGAHTAKGPVRPLRRLLQGIDPMTTAAVFSEAKCVGERNVDGEDCFILKVSASQETLKSRSEGPAEIIRHVIMGSFSQKTGLLLHIEDSHLTRIQSNGGDSVYWETTINSYLKDYRAVEGIVVAHRGRSVVTLYKFGDTATSHSRTKMEEDWSIEEVAFNVPGLSVDCFIPPADVRTKVAVSDKMKC